MKLILSFLFGLCAITVSLSQSNNGAYITLDSVVSSVDGFSVYTEKFMYRDSKVIEKIVFDAFSTTDKYEYQFDEEGNKISEVQSYKDNDEEIYTFSIKTTFSHEESKITEKKYEWNIDSSDWVIIYKHISYLNEKQLPDSLFYYNWDSKTKTFSLFAEKTFKYNDHGKTLLSLNVYNLNVYNLISANKTEYSYNENQNITSIDSYYWIDSTNTWKPSYAGSFKYIYDINNNILEETEYRNEELNNKKTYFYDELNNRNKEICFYWDGDKNEWLAGDTVSYVFDKDFLFNDLIFGDYSTEDFPFYSRPLSVKINDEYVGDEKLPLDVILYYSDIVLSTSLIANDNLSTSFFPNPAQNQLFITEGITNVTIQDIRGNIHLNVANPTTELDLSTLENGSYILHLRSEQGVTSEKLIISK